jgi:glycosyltransferase involved in cell wall biosynthesis
MTKMKLLIFLHSMTLGGAERVTASLANYWTARGWNVTIATVDAASSDFYALDPQIGRVALGLAGDSTNLVHAISANFERIRALRALVYELQPQVALAMMTNANIALALACRGIPGVHVIGSERNFPGRAHVHPAWNVLRRMQYGALQAVVAQTSECADWIRRHTSARDVPVIPNFVSWPLPVQAPEVQPEAACRTGRRILLAAGRLVGQKNFAVLIKAFMHLAHRHPDWDLVILGEGPLEHALRDQAATSGLADRVFLPGLIGNPGAWYERADLYVMTSEFEGFPNTLVEALAYGVPAVSFDCDTGPRDIIRQNVDGLLIPANDAQALQEALDRLMTDAKLRGRMAERAVEARQRFSIERIAGLWEDLFRKDIATGDFPMARPCQRQ